jgi:hypothetical protein
LIPKLFALVFGVWCWVGAGAALRQSMEDGEVGRVAIAIFYDFIFLFLN